MRYRVSFELDDIPDGVTLDGVRKLIAVFVNERAGCLRPAPRSLVITALDTGAGYRREADEKLSALARRIEEATAHFRRDDTTDLLDLIRAALASHLNYTRELADRVAALEARKEES